MKVKEERKTTESEITVVVEDSARREMKISTGLNFLDHQIKQIAWRLCMNIDATVKTKGYKSSHTISEDLGIVLGKALLQLYTKKCAEGVNGAGSAFGIIDEARAFAAVSIEGRANSFIKVCSAVERLKKVEDMSTADMYAFVEGLAQGMRATVQLEIITGRDAHHSWEAAYRALGEALKAALSENKWRANTAGAGVKGTLE